MAFQDARDAQKGFANTVVITTELYSTDIKFKFNSGSDPSSSVFGLTLEKISGSVPRIVIIIIITGEKSGPVYRYENFPENA